MVGSQFNNSAETSGGGENGNGGGGKGGKGGNGGGGGDGDGGGLGGGEGWNTWTCSTCDLALDDTVAFGTFSDDQRLTCDEAKSDTTHCETKWQTPLGILTAPRRCECSVTYIFQYPPPPPPWGTWTCETCDLTPDGIVERGTFSDGEIMACGGNSNATHCETDLYGLSGSDESGLFRRRCECSLRVPSSDSMGRRKLQSFETYDACTCSPYTPPPTSPPISGARRLQTHPDTDASKTW
jgi:hypothetical protein